MSSSKTWCRECNVLLRSHNRCHRNQKICNRCLEKIPCDLIINCGNFHAELHTEAMTQRNLRKLLANVERLSKQLTAEKEASRQNDSQN